MKSQNPQLEIEIQEAADELPFEAYEYYRQCCRNCEPEELNGGIEPDDYEGWDITQKEAEAAVYLAYRWLMLGEE